MEGRATRVAEITPSASGHSLQHGRTSEEEGGGTSAAHEKAGILFLGFNQDQTCLAIGTCHGFILFSTESFALLHSEACGSVSIVEMLFRTSLVALVGSSGACPDRQLTMWNTKERRSICQLQFGAEVHSVKMNHRRLVALLRCKIHILDLKSMKTLHVIDRIAARWVNPALGWLSAASDCGYLATPLVLAGTGQIATAGCQGASAPESNETGLGLITIVDTYTLKSVGVLLAHQSPVQALCLNPTGGLLATASSKGTVIRLFAVPSFDLCCVFRRGTSPCLIFGLLFSRDSVHICASASSGTVHIFKNSEKVLHSLHLGAEDTAVGAKEPFDITESCDPTASASGTEQPSCHEISGTGSEDACDSDEDLSDWNVVSERPDRFSDLTGGVRACSSGFSVTGSKESAIRTLSEVSGYAAATSARYASTLFQLLPKPCRELVDSPRTFAWVRLRGHHDPCMSSCVASLSHSSGDLGGSYLASVIVSSRSSGTSGIRPEVFVATARGCAHVYEWNASTGGECRLRTEHSFVHHGLQSCGPSHPPAASMSAHAQDKSAPCPEESGPVNIICSGAAAYTSAESAPETGEETFSEVQESFEA